MVSACEFWLDRIIASRGNVGNDGSTAAPDGTFEAPRGYSPEQEPYNPNTYAQDGVPYEQQLIWALFKYTIEAGKILGKQSEYPTGPRGTLEEVFAKLDTGLHHSKDRPGNQIGTVNGVSPLAEYKYGNSAQHDPTHRHFSHLMALYPGDQINRYYPEFEEAARASLNGRGNGGTGWSLAQKINAWARLKDGNRARTLLKNALNDATRGGAGIYENLFDAHPPFQIDGNFGATAGIAEMLIQSHREYIEVLPALPTAWSSGSFTGLKAQGNFTVDLEWAGGMPTRCTVYSGSGGTLRIKFGNSDVQVISTSRGGSYSISF